MHGTSPYPRPDGHHRSDDDDDDSVDLDMGDLNDLDEELKNQWEMGNQREVTREEERNVLMKGGAEM